MANSTFKTAGIPRTGFDYQDLMGIDVLIRFFRDPSLFEWVELESDEPKVGKLDDVVAARTDGKFELIQVKFTADSGTYRLGWAWLLERKGKGSSLLQKWSDALQRVLALGPVFSAKLRTNRLPDSDFQKSLVGNFIDFNSLEPNMKHKVADELGGEDSARSFFERFEFGHSEKLVDDLETALKQQIVPSDTDHSGWLLLRDHVKKWASRKSLPEPDGKIRHDHLVQIITKRRPKPIPQDFVVPESYQVPSDDFHRVLMRRIRAKSHPISVLWGSPGRGKSTFLSYLAKSLRDEDLPVIRHHYFLSLDDSTIDRTSFPEIAHSLMHQIFALYPDAVRSLKNAPDQLREWVKSCGAHFAKENKRFYLIVDGLDHVWREQQSITQMEHLFNYLLPCPENVCLLVGTQRVPSNQLPLRLSQKAKPDDWIEVPPMDRAAVEAWVTAQHSVGRLLLRHDGKNVRNAELSCVCEAFYEICGGNPLHLIYSLEALVRRGLAVSKEDIYEMPSCPDGDIREYYARLWARISESGKKILHAIAGCDFCWPLNGLHQCFGSTHEIDHLLEHRRTGLTPFHGSLLAFVREQTNHQFLVQLALPTVADWLENHASDYLKWAWLWVVRARNGNPDSLLNGVSRQWALASLAVGWPASQIEVILSEAEQIAFSMHDFAKTMQIRSLKTRIYNGPQFQTNRFNDFQEAAIRTASNQQQILILADQLPLATDNEIITLARCLNGTDFDSIGTDCVEALRDEVNRPIALKHALPNDFSNTIEVFVEALVEFGQFDPKLLLNFLGQFRDYTRLFRAFFQHSVRTQNFDAICDMLPFLNGDEYSNVRILAENAAVRVSCQQGIDLHVRLSPSQEISPLLSCWYRLRGIIPPQPCSLAGISQDAIQERYDFGPNPELDHFLHNLFYLLLDLSLDTEGECSPVLIGVDTLKMGWLREAMDHFWEAALQISKDHSMVSFEGLFLGVADLPTVKAEQRPSDPESAQYRAFRHTVGEIALDLHALKCAISTPEAVSREEFEVARSSVHWKDEIWLARELAERRKWISPPAIELLVQNLADSEAKYVTEFNERAERWIELAQLSLLYQVGEAEEYVLRAADCITGYGSHKDVWIFEVLSSVQYAHQIGDVDIKPWLKQLASIIEEITNFTDGDETNHAPSEYVDLVTFASREWLPSLYAYFVARDRNKLAEQTLSAILKQLDYSEPAARALANSLVDEVDIRTLEALENDGDQNITGILTKRREFLGTRTAQAVSLDDTQEAQNDDIGWRGKSPNVSRYGADELEKLLNRVNTHTVGFERRDDCLIRWLKHWAENGKGIEALRAIDSYFNKSDNPMLPNSLYDAAFEVSLKYEGKKRAYDWIVRAHVEGHGWRSFWNNREDIISRLESVAKHYRKDWKEFILDTSVQPKFWAKRRFSFVIGSEWLVMFLYLVGEQNTATQLVDEMVNLTVDLAHDQPLSTPEWLK